jgi:coenzyme F420-reducing hydrogenase beta subunit
MLSLLGEMRRAGGRYALFVLPCQAMALEKLRRVVPALAAQVRWTLGLFCHYNLPRQATEELLARYRVDLRRLRRLEYRGGEWPGRLRATLDDGSSFSLPEPLRKPSLSYLYALHATDRCLLCPDGFCLFADLALGDFWCRDYGGELGRRERHTAILARTAAGTRALEIATAQGLLALGPLPEDQPLGRMNAVAAEKVGIALAFAARRRRRGAPSPDFGLAAPAGERAWSRSPYALLAGVRRNPTLRRFALALLFSPAGELAGRLSGLRRKLRRGAAGAGGERP